MDKRVAHVQQASFSCRLPSPGRINVISCAERKVWYRWWFRPWKTKEAVSNIRGLPDLEPSDSWDTERRIGYVTGRGGGMKRLRNK